VAPGARSRPFSAQVQGARRQRAKESYLSYVLCFLDFKSISRRINRPPPRRYNPSRTGVSDPCQSRPGGLGWIFRNTAPRLGSGRGQASSRKGGRRRKKIPEFAEPSRHRERSSRTGRCGGPGCQRPTPARPVTGLPPRAAGAGASASTRSGNCPDPCDLRRVGCSVLISFVSRLASSPRRVPLSARLVPVRSVLLVPLGVARPAFLPVLHKAPS
jgi:hypothetical protein